MSSLKIRARRHSIVRRLLALVGVGIAIAVTPAAQASIASSRQALEARVLDIRAAIDAPVAPGTPDKVLAQWGNWGNWNNWVNWNNWPNWGNWGNWFNR
jgi:hypothetical protein